MGFEESLEPLAGGSISRAVPLGFRSGPSVAVEMLSQEPEDGESVEDEFALAGGRTPLANAGASFNDLMGFLVKAGDALPREAASCMDGEKGGRFCVFESRRSVVEKGARWVCESAISGPLDFFSLRSRRAEPR